MRISSIIYLLIALGSGAGLVCAVSFSWGVMAVFWMGLIFGCSVVLFLLDTRS